MYQPHPVQTPEATTIAQWLGGELREGERAPAALTGLATLALAGPEDISFVASAKFLHEAEQSRAGLLITAAAWDVPGRARVVVTEVWEAVAQLMERLYPAPAAPAGIHPTAILGEGVSVGAGASVGPYCVLGDGCLIGPEAVLGPHCILDAGCQVGARSRLTARVTLRGPVQLGERVLIHPGAVLGADGFKFEVVAGRPRKIPQVGTVIVEDDVEIGANTTIDRAFLYETRIGRGTKLDNLVQLGHNVQVGPGCMMAAQVGVAGSTVIGTGCILGGQVGVRDGIAIADGVMIGAQTGINAPITERGIYQGTPSVPVKDYWRQSASLGRLPETTRRVHALERQLAQAEAARAELERRLAALEERCGSEDR